MISWAGPCRTNGPLDFFLIIREGQYVENDVIVPGQEIDVGQEMIGKNEDPDYVYQFNMTGIRPSYRYNISVRAVLEDGLEGEDASMSFTSEDGCKFA